MKHTLCFCSLLAALLLLTAGNAYAQRSHTTGLFLNAHLNGTGITYNFDAFNNNPDETHSGGGFGIQGGYGLSPLVTLYLGLNGSVMDNNDIQDAYTLAHVDIGARFNLNAGRPTVPYLNAALAFRQATFDVGPGEIEYSGPGLTLGGGVQFFLSPPVALDVGLQATFGTFNEVKAGGITVDIDNINASSARLIFGVTFYPTR